MLLKALLVVYLASSKNPPNSNKTDHKTHGMAGMKGDNIAQ